MHWKEIWVKDSIILRYHRRYYLYLLSKKRSIMTEANSTEERRQTALDVLMIPEYRNFIISRFFYIMALRMVTTIVGWRIYEITHILWHRLIGLSEFLPAFTLAFGCRSVCIRQE